jgi:hypothetical protein
MIKIKFSQATPWRTLNLEHVDGDPHENSWGGGNLEVNSLFVTVCCCSIKGKVLLVFVCTRAHKRGWLTKDKRLYTETTEDERDGTPSTASLLVSPLVSVYCLLLTGVPVPPLTKERNLLCSIGNV